MSVDSFVWLLGQDGGGAAGVEPIFSPVTIVVGLVAFAAVAAAVYAFAFGMPALRAQIEDSKAKLDEKNNQLDKQQRANQDKIKDLTF